MPSATILGIRVQTTEMGLSFPVLFYYRSTCWSFEWLLFTSLLNTTESAILLEQSLSEIKKK